MDRLVEGRARRVRQAITARGVQYQLSVRLIRVLRQEATGWKIAHAMVGIRDQLEGHVPCAYLIPSVLEVRWIIVLRILTLHRGAVILQAAFVRLDIMDRMVELVRNVLQIIFVQVELSSPNVVMTIWLHPLEATRPQLVSVRRDGMGLQTEFAQSVRSDHGVLGVHGMYVP
jgi:hypothetical protein